MVENETFAHHDSHRYANDRRQAKLTLVLLGLFTVVITLIVLALAQV